MDVGGMAEHLLGLFASAGAPGGEGSQEGGAAPGGAPSFVTNGSSGTSTSTGGTSQGVGGREAELGAAELQALAGVIVDSAVSRGGVPCTRWRARRCPR